MSRSITFRCPDELYDQVTAACERRSIALSTFMLGAVRLSLSGSPERVDAWMRDNPYVGLVEADPLTPSKLAKIASTWGRGGGGGKATGPAIELTVGPQHPKPGSRLKGKKK